MYKVKFFALQDNNRHEFYVPDRVVANIVCSPEYHLINAMFQYSYMKQDPNIPTAESIIQIGEIIRNRHDVARRM